MTTEQHEENRRTLQWAAQRAVKKEPFLPSEGVVSTGRGKVDDWAKEVEKKEDK